MSFIQYANYHDSGLPWVGSIPSHWNVRRLKTLFTLVNRQPREEDKIVTAFRDGQVTLRANRREDGFTNSLKEIGYQGVRRGDLVIHAMDGFAGAIGVSDSDGKSTPVYSVCVSNAEADAWYYALLLRHMALSGFVTALARGVRERSTEFRWSDASVLALPHPPLSEQRSIVTFLNRETGKIDALIEEQKRLIELLKEKRQAVISYAVTKGLNPNAPMKDSGVDVLGEIPTHWKLVKLKHIGFFNAGAGFPHEEQGVEGEELSFHKVNALGQADAQGYLLQSENTISRSTAARLRAFVFPAETIVFAKIGAALLLGRIRRLGEEACLDNNMMGYIVDRTQNIDFVAHLMSLIRFDLIANPGTVPSLNESQIAEVQVAVPDAEEQTRIATYLADETGRIDALVRESEAAITLLQERRSALITAAVTGKIDVRSLIPDQVEAA